MTSVDWAIVASTWSGSSGMVFASRRGATSSRATSSEAAACRGGQSACRSWRRSSARSRWSARRGRDIADGMRFLQFYFALPLAMIVLSVTLVPFFHNAKVYTAYEYLERRFDAKTRAFTSLLFLISRSMSLGVVISAPAVVLLRRPRCRPDDDGAADWRADGDLHHVRRRAGGDLDRRQADGAHRRRPGRRGRGAGPRIARRSRRRAGAADRRRSRAAFRRSISRSI